MEIPHEIINILNININGFALIESSIILSLDNEQNYYLSELINYLGDSSNKERHLFKPITTSNSFFNSENKKTMIIKIEKNLIIGFLLYEYRPIILRNEYNLNYFSKIILTISDFYIFRQYQRMNYGKELFDKLILIEGVKPVSMAFEFPNRALINFLNKNYGINNPIHQINNIITYSNFSDKSFNRFLDDYHRVIDINKMESDIDNYRKWSPLNKDYYKIYNSGYTYKNIFPLQFKKDTININNKRYNNIKNIETNYFNNNINILRNIDRNKNKIRDNKAKYRYSYDYENKNNLNLQLNDMNLSSIENNKKINNNNYGNYNNENNNILNMKKKYHLVDKKNIYGKQNIDNTLQNQNLTNLNDIDSSNLRKNEYYFKFNDYYLNGSNNAHSLNYFNSDIYNNKNPVKENYYNHLNDENRHLKSSIFKQKEKSDKLARNINNLNNRIIESSYKTPQKNNYNKEIYYHKNRSFATIFDSIQNKSREEKDFDNYKNYIYSQEYSYY